jgi:putative transposase
MSRQLEINFRPHGGKRAGAGRKPKGAAALVSHVRRASFNRPSPVHVTLKVRHDVPNLRARARFQTIRQVLKAARGRHGVRLAEFAVLGDHLHLIVEADSTCCLSRGLQGLCVRLTRALNRVLDRRGSMFADRFHSRLLRTPTELVRAIRYVIDNACRHFGLPDTVCSSRAPDAQELLEAPRGWLLRIGWKRAPLRERIAPRSRWSCIGGRRLLLWDA